MLKLDQQQIQEIVEQLDSGYRAFCHKTTGELIFIIDSSKFPVIDIDELEEAEKAKIEAAPDEYIEIEAMRSHDSYQVMVDFAEQLTNLRLQEQLFRALNKRGPFREFKYVIDNAGPFRENWFAFKNQRYFDWVSRQVDASE